MHKRPKRLIDNDFPYNLLLETYGLEVVDNFPTYIYEIGKKNLSYVVFRYIDSEFDDLIDKHLLLLRYEYKKSFVQIGKHLGRSSSWVAYKLKRVMSYEFKSNLINFIERYFAKPFDVIQQNIIIKDEVIRGLGIDVVQFQPETYKFLKVRNLTTIGDILSCIFNDDGNLTDEAEINSQLTYYIKSDLIQKLKAYTFDSNSSISSADMYQFLQARNLIMNPIPNKDYKKPMYMKQISEYTMGELLISLIDDTGKIVCKEEELAVNDIKIIQRKINLFMRDIAKFFM